MPVIRRTIPGWVQQSLEDSCWAAVLDAWSRVDPRLPRLRQGPLIRRWGEGATGGITPETKIPQIAAAYDLRWGGFRSGELTAYVRQRLPTSHIFCAYRVADYHHAVLIYRLRENGNNDIACMDPQGGRYYKVRSLAWIESRGDFAVMRKA